MDFFLVHGVTKSLTWLSDFHFNTHGCTHMFIAALFIIAKLWRQTKYLLTDEWINKKCGIYIYTIEYYSAWNWRKFWYMLQNGWPWSHYAKWNMSAEKHKYLMIPFIWVTKSRQNWGQQLTVVVPRTRGMEEQSYYFTKFNLQNITHPLKRIHLNQF